MRNHLEIKADWQSSYRRLPYTDDLELNSNPLQTFQISCLTISFMTWAGVWTKYFGMPDILNSLTASVLVVIAFLPNIRQIGHSLQNNVMFLILFLGLVAFSSIDDANIILVLQKLASYSLAIFAGLLLTLQPQSSGLILAKSFRNSSSILCFSSLVLLALGSSSVFGSSAGASSGMFSGVTPHKTFLTNAVAIGMLMSCWMLSHVDNKMTDRAISILHIVLAVPVLIIGGGGQSLILVALGVSSLVLLKFRVFYVAFCLLLVGLLTSVALPWVTGIVRFLSEVTGKDVTLAGRTDIWRFGLQLVDEKPLLGHGFSNIGRSQSFQEWQRPFFEATFGANMTIPHLHNQWIEITYMFGYIGLTLLLTFFLFQLVQLFKKEDRLRSFLALLFAYFAVMSGYNAPFFSNTADGFILLAFVFLVGNSRVVASKL